MASLIYDSFFDDLAGGQVIPKSDTYYVMLVGSGYTPSKGSHTKRSDVTSEVSGTGYTSGGKASACTVALDTTGHKLTLTFATTSWANASIAGAVGAVIYKHRGGLATADELVMYVDDGGSFTSTNGTFTQSFSTPLTINN